MRECGAHDPVPQRVVAMVNNKGGVGKTTCTLNIAAGLARKNRKVLIVDADPQANAGLVLLGAKLFDLPHSLYDVLLEPDRHVGEIIIPTPSKASTSPPRRPASPMPS